MAGRWKKEISNVRARLLVSKGLNGDGLDRHYERFRERRGEGEEEGKKGGS